MNIFKRGTNYIIERGSPTKVSKHALKKYAMRKMCGETFKERFKNFFNNRTGYYS